MGSDQPWSAGEGLAVEREGRALTSDSGGDYDGGCDSNDDGEWLALPGLPSDSSGADAGSGGDGSDADTGSGGSDGSGVYVMAQWRNGVILTIKRRAVVEMVWFSTGP